MPDQPKIHPFRRWMAPLLIMLLTPTLVVVMWMSTIHYDGSIIAFLQAGLQQWIPLLPAPGLKPLTIALIWVFAQWLFLRFLPGKTVEGPISPRGNRPVYKDNGVLAWVLTHGILFGLLYPLGIVNPGALYSIYGSFLITLNIGVFLFCILLYIKGRLFPSGFDTVHTGYFLFDFFQGIELYPAIAGTPLKQLINCRVSMMGWSVISISFIISQYQIQGFVSTSIIVSVFLIVVYLLKFFIWESGYLSSMDVMHDRFGYYICWGILVWVPAIYCLVPLYLVSHPIQISFPVMALIIGFGLLSIWVNYDIDRQRQKFRLSGGKMKIWGKDPVSITAEYITGDGKTHQSLLLVSGWWRISRHFHYVPELTLAVSWTISAGFTHFVPWFYVLFLFILLMDRAVRDEKRCSKKYGQYWDEYKEIVRYRVFPGLF